MLTKTGSLNELRAIALVEVLLHAGIDEFCICPGARNAPLLTLLEQQEDVKLFTWFEERSAAFFALGRARLRKKPVAIVTTSGTACAELLAAVMEAYYTGVPLLCVTADRPRRFRGTGAPQAAEQVGLFGPYVQFEKDLEGESFSLEGWQQTAPAHLNICFEEPSKEATAYPKITLQPYKKPKREASSGQLLDQFFKGCQFPFVVVGTLKTEDREAVVQFLEQLQVPVYLEAVSGLREDPRLNHLLIRAITAFKEIPYPVDGVLRIGGVPTFRLWRDLEDNHERIKVCSINDVPFSGLSWGNHIHTPITAFLEKYDPPPYSLDASKSWLNADRMRHMQLLQHYAEYPDRESSLVHQLSCKIPKDALVYLGNSLPIREWDLAATYRPKNFHLFANRGVNGIDGQISTFLGLTSPGKENWALIGDLTALYDMAAFWILPQLKDTVINLVIINNGGGQIFKMFSSSIFINAHEISFEPLARMWGLDYEKWTEIPQEVLSTKSRLIELVPR